VLGRIECNDNQTDSLLVSQGYAPLGGLGMTSGAVMIWLERLRARVLMKFPSARDLHGMNSRRTDDAGEVPQKRGEHTTYRTKGVAEVTVVDIPAVEYTS